MQKKPLVEVNNIGLSLWVGETQRGEGTGGPLFSSTYAWYILTPTTGTFSFTYINVHIHVTKSTNMALDMQVINSFDINLLECKIQDMACWRDEGRERERERERERRGEKRRERLKRMLYTTTPTLN